MSGALPTHLLNFCHHFPGDNADFTCPKLELWGSFSYSQQKSLSGGSFLLVLVIGVVAGTYSSIGIAAQFLVAWESGDFGRVLARLRLRRPTAAAAR